MSVFDWFVIIVGLGGGTAAVARVPSFWKDQWSGAFRQPDSAPAWWLWGQPFWRAYLRGYPLGAVAFLIVMASFAASNLMQRSPDEAGPAFWALLPGGLALAVATVLGLGLVFINRPKWVVAPRHRSEPGVLQEWRRRRRASHGT